MLTLLVLLNDLFTDLTFGGVSEALDSMGTGLIAWNELFAVRAFHIFITLFIFTTWLLLLCHKLLLAAKHFSIPLGFDV